MLKKNQSVKVTITDLNNLGYGVCRIDGIVVFVAHAIDGDELRIKIIKVNKTYAVGMIEEILTPSVYRTEKACQAKGCGGCAYLGITYAHECELKAHYVKHAFLKAGISRVKVNDVITAGKTQGYRNKAQYAIGAQADGSYQIGFYAPKSHRIVSAPNCLLQPPVFSAILSELMAFLSSFPIPAYDEQTGKGILRHLYLRHAKATDEVLLTLVVTQAHFPYQEELLNRIKEKMPKVVGVYLNINPQNTNVICSDEFVHLWGKTRLSDKLCGLNFSITPASFYQVNAQATEKLYSLGKEMLDLQGEETLLDLYCGIGSIGLSMADKVAKVIGIEIVESAVECAKENAKNNHITNASFFCADAGKVETFLEKAEEAHGKIRPNVVVFDPPRKGCSPDILRQTGEVWQPKKILYISCDVDTLARDVALLAPYGYQTEEVTPVNLFPRTGHCECVCLLTKER